MNAIGGARAYCGKFMSLPYIDPEELHQLPCAKVPFTSMINKDPTSEERLTKYESVDLRPAAARTHVEVS